MPVPEQYSHSCPSMTPEPLQRGQTSSPEPGVPDRTSSPGRTVFFIVGSCDGFVAIVRSSTLIFDERREVSVVAPAISPQEVNRIGRQAKRLCHRHAYPDPRL